MMYVTLSSGARIRIQSKQGDKAPPWNPAGNYYKITLSMNGKLTTFDFWDSYHSMMEGKACDERGALACFASDALIGMSSNSVDDIASEFGYDKPSEAYKVFRGVKKAQKQAERLGLSDEDLSELENH